ncbi:hypothetical protein K4K54_002124 [Colletotrichum sp. SAR 10_86]|nr:hypothetical protein K4K51_000542 [Colletotrichum sp. SAR 10_75]KAI8204442.1 hypothetical protein KHU50_002786 [Colletotrichum sp. SAR 10_65]KAI8213736.1 hypothetical protein K4K52_003736 [Colletotrichum sp. SAR 10_76]KAI8228558.1 hypothetical protein K4K54_002124 [Colletotrichum sp. SAR 10_86]KAJ5004642.1 hypothetical protein K4K48_009241 [Colletotrichum sp. SAR 10_66]
METAGAKRALLIGSPVHGLKGTDNDLKTMAKLLKSHGFDVGNDAYVKTLFRETATRQNILAAWDALIINASRDDTVVIYYSGHGVCIESDGPSQKSGSPSKIQFIVPYDFDCSLTTWKGILDGELSLLLRRTTGKTRNVTYILDCCHSARLGRKLGDVSFEPKAFGLPKSLYTDLFEIMERLKQAGKLTEDHLETNRHAVRIAAAATDETAWEYHEDGHNYMGLLTKNLDRALTNSSRQRSWRDVMLEVGILVGQDHPGGNQHPRSAGPDNRKPFSMTTTTTGALLATIWDEGYTTPLLNLRKEHNKVLLHDNRGLKLAVKYLNNDVALEDAMERLLDHAKEYGQARSILALRSGVDEELLGEEVDIVLGVESSGKKTILTRRSDS